MKTIRKRGVCFVLALLMIAAMFQLSQKGTTVLADETNDFNKNLTVFFADKEAEIQQGKVIDTLPEGISYDEKTGVLTLDHCDSKDPIFIPDGDFLKVKVVGECTIKELIAVDDTQIQLTGNGVLNTSALKAEQFIMDSGTLNISSKTSEYLENSFGGSYGINSNWGDLSDGKKPNSFKILGGEVNIDLSEEVLTKYNTKWRFVGFDVQSGNLEIRNAKVRINLGENKWLGLGIGWVGSGDKPNGGKLTMENGTLEIISSDYQAYFFEFKNEGDPLHYYIGTDGPEKEVSFNEAFERKTYESSTDDSSISRYERQTEGKGYLLVTNETVETVPPVTPSPQPSDTPVTPSPKPSDTPTIKAYEDVPKTGTWYSEAVYYATEKGYMAGTGNDKFSPDGTVTRGTIAQILYAAEGKPAVTKENQFSDVASNQWYAKAVNWAAEKKLVAGYGGGKFGPNDPVTRQQMVAIMYQYAKMKGYDLTANANLSGFKDQSKISKWAMEPMKWAVGHKIISGTGNGIEPNGTATRAQIAVILQAFDKNVRK